MEPVQEPTQAASRPEVETRSVAEELQRHRGWFLALGVLLVVVGAWALRSSLATTLLSVLLLGWSLIIGGVAEVVHAFGARRSRGFTLHLLSGVLGMVVGLLVLRTPLASALTLSLLAVGWLLTSGLFRIVASLLNRQHGWGWEVVNGAVSVLLGALVWRQLPGSALWLIGTFVGIELMFRGLAWISFSLGLRSLQRRQAAPAA
jgi:uncharacterized membrane protein HdeD (DUF308 family)